MQDPEEDTEWNDILRQQGILPPRPPSPSAQIEQALEEAVEKAHANRLEGKSLDELDELEEDELEDPNFIDQYRQKRMAELMAQASREKFGDIVYITKAEYQQEVTRASESCVVVLHIAASDSVQSRLLHGLLLRIAPRYKEIKFVEIECRQINDRFPSDQCPTILVYHKTNVVCQQVTLIGMGGNACSVEDVERILVKSKAVKPEDGRLLENRRAGQSGDSDDYDEEDN